MSDEARALFRRVLRSLPADLGKHAAGLGLSHSVARRRLQELERLRLVRVAEDGTLRADDPRVTLGRLLDQEEAGLDQQRHHLLLLRQSIAAFEADYRRGLQLSGPSVPPWEHVAHGDAGAVVENLIRSSEGPILQAVISVPAVPDADTRVTQRREALIASDRERRSVLPLSIFTHPEWRAFAEQRTRQGEAQRFLDDVPCEFAAFGTAAVLLPDGTHGEPDFVLVRWPLLIQVFLGLFEELWRRAEPVHEGATQKEDQKLLELLALGFKDEAIARHSGLSLRTVRRRVAGLMVEHGVDTRFQLGLAVSRRGLLD